MGSDPTHNSLPARTRHGTTYDLRDYDEESGDILILKMWREQWYQYMCDALRLFHFELPELQADLLIFDVEQDGPQKIVDFAAEFGMALDIGQPQSREIHPI